MDIIKELNGKKIDDIILFEKQYHLKWNQEMNKNIVSDHLIESLYHYIHIKHQIHIHYKVIKDYTENLFLIYQNSKEFKHIHQLYLKIIKDFVHLNQTLDFDHPMEIFTCLYYCLNHGYLSKSHEFTYDPKIKNDIFFLFPLSILEGKGSCRHTSSFLNDTFHEFNYESYLLFMNTNHSDTFNHVSTLYTGKNSSYLLDVTNHCLFFIDDQKKVYPMTSIQTKIPVKPYDFPLKEKKLSSLLKPTTESLSEFLKIYNKSIQICETEKNIFEQFYHEHLNLYQELIDKKKILYKKQQKLFTLE